MENKDSNVYTEFVPEKEGTAKLFKSRWMDLLTRTSPWIIIPLDLLIIAGLLWFGHAQGYTNLADQWWWFLVGVFSWTLMEYVMHRFAFHFESRKEKVQKAVYTIHLVHHHYPNDEDRLFQPPLVNIILAAVFVGIFYLIMGKLTFVFTPGLVLGYVLYSSTHYSIHKIKPPFKFLQPIWRHHTLHHYRYQNKAFGVSSPFWDMIFGTMPPKEIRNEK